MVLQDWFLEYDLNLNINYSFPMILKFYKDIFQLKKENRQQILEKT